MNRDEQERPPLAPGGAAWNSLGSARERAVFGVQRRIIWPLEDATEGLGTRGRIGVFGGGLAVAAAAAALAIALSGGGSGSTSDAPPVAIVKEASSAQPVTPAAVPQPKAEKKASKPTGPTLHGAPPSFAPAKDVKAGVGDGKALGSSGDGTGASGAVPAERGAGNGGDSKAGPAADEAVTSDLPTASASSAGESAATAKIGTTPGATASDATQGAGATGGGAGVEASSTFAGEPAPRAAKRVARRFAEAFVVYEVGGVDSGVRDAFHQTTTKQLSKSLLRRPPRQPASVKVPKAKVVTVVAGPSKGKVYTVSVSLLRVGVTSELRLQMEQGPGKKWQVTNVLG